MNIGNEDAYHIHDFVNYYRIAFCVHKLFLFHW